MTWILENYQFLLTTIAIIVGPIFGAWIAIRLEASRFQKIRKMEIFQTLMRTRNLGLSFDHVNALNQVQVEFHKHEAVISSWREYLDHLSKPSLDNNDQEQISQRFEDGRKTLAKLIHEISKVLNFKIEKMDIFERNYTPQGWVDDEQRQRLMREMVLQVLHGQRAVQINLCDPTVDVQPRVGLFPPKPN